MATAVGFLFRLGRTMRAAPESLAGTKVPPLFMGAQGVYTSCVLLLYTMPKDSKSQEGKVLKDIRQFLGLSQDGFAALLGSTKSTVSRRENGSNPMLTLSEVVKLEEALSQRGKEIKDFLQSPDTQNA
jgi:DNA-binding XRE family transcriptional regulator